jgi:manganese/iron transport system ATP-binding protein
MALNTLLRRHEAHHTDAPVVSFEHVSVRYNGTPPALEDVTFDLWPGERVAVVGPNGAGKSTLLKVVAGILAPSSGRADVYGYGAGGHICIGYVPQRSNVDWNFPVSVADVVMMGRVAKIGLLRQASRGDWQRVADALRRVGMDQFASRQIGELSGGQQQRVLIARARPQEAQLLLMDEPLTGLDIPAQEAIFGILDQLKLQRMTVLVSTHDLQLASDKFDRLMLLNRTLLGLGHPGEVLTPQNLQRAYGSHLTVLTGAEGVIALSDTCCDGDNHG